MGLRRTVEPVADAITIHTAKKQCEIAPSDYTHDAHLQRLISGAVRDVERFTRRALVNQTWELTQSRFPDYSLCLPRPPLASVTSINYVDSSGATTLLDPALYEVSDESPAVLQPVYGQVWPETQPGTRTAVTITYVAGYGVDSTTVPDEFKNVIAELVLFRFSVGRGDVPAADIPKHIQWSLKSLRCGVVLGAYGVRR